MVVRPDVINALFPLFFKNFFVFLLLCFGLYFLLGIFVSFVDLFVLPNAGLVFLIVFILTFFSISFRLIILRLTKYYFYETNAVKEFRFIVISRKSVVYSRITNIVLKVSLWDRITGAGSITLHTGDDEMPDLVIRYVKDPVKLEELVYSLIHKKNSHVSHVVDM